MRLMAFPTIASYVARKYASLVPNSSWNARLETPARATSLATVASVPALRDLLDHRPNQAAALVAGHRIVAETAGAGVQLRVKRLGPASMAYAVQVRLRGAGNHVVRCPMSACLS
jgi:hypothetical protein